MGTVIDEVLNFCRSVNMTTMFGNPGSTELPFLKNFPPDFRYILGLHEGVVVGMAVGHALASEQATLVNLHTTAGMGNAIGAIVNAYKAKAPLVITAGQQDRAQIRTEPFLWGKQLEFVKTYTKWADEPHRALDVPEAVARGYHIAMTEPRGPVFISICMDGLDQECPPVVPRQVSYTMMPNPAAVRRAAELVNHGQRIAIVAGEDVDASGAWDDTVRLAEVLQAGVFGPPEGHRNGFPTSHPLFQGHLPPAIKPLGEKLQDYDTVLVLGTTVFLYYPYVPGPVLREGTQLIHFTCDPSEASRALLGFSVIGNVAAGVKQLLDLVKTDSRRQSPPTWKPIKVTGKKPITTEFLYQTLAEVLPPHAIIAEEAESSRPVMQRQLRLSEPRSFIATASGGLGVAMPAAVGAKLARPDRPVVCLVGDGASMYAIQSLWSALTYEAKVVFIVFNNQEYAILKSFCEFTNSPNVPGLELPGFDFVALAKGYGLNAIQVQEPDELASALEKAFQSPKAILIDVQIDKSIPPLIP